MRLKSIDIQGFKSFPDRTLLEFDSGVTAIIGPNGSGKSNIADAMRWVLGEQSTRTLRGGKMEDVIFGGTQARHAQGVASVTLNIDNSDRTLPCDSDEVAVMRRLYRSGDSEYRINGAQVRLRDINELFMDTGLGRDGYAIIGQGRVAEIVSARSGERREIFEEAAGISKFRYRKTEAEHRLEQAEENLLRLRDILEELRTRVKPLEEQSEKAKKFLEYSDEKKTLEISLWVNSLSVLHEKMSALEDKLLLAKNEHAAAQEAVTQCEADYNSAMEENRGVAIENERLRGEIADRTKRSADTERDEAVTKNEIEHWQQDIKAAEENIETASRSQEQLAADIEAAQKKCDAQAALCVETEKAVAEKEREIDEKSEGLSTLISQGESLRIRRTAAFEAIEKAKIDAVASSTMLCESEKTLGTMDETRASLNQTLTDAKREYEDCCALLKTIAENLASLENSKGGYLLKRQSRSQKLDDIMRQLSDKQKEIDAFRQRAHVLSELDKNMEGFGSSVRFVMNAAKRGTLGGIHGPVSTLIDTPGDYTTAIETALGAAVQNIVVENEDTAKRAINMLKQNEAGRATFLPLTSVRGSTIDTSHAENLYGYIGLASELVTCEAKYSQVVRFLLGRTVVAQDLDAAVAIAKKNGYRFRIVTLDGQVVNAGGSMTGGYSSRSAGIIGRKKEIEELLAKAKAAEDKKALIDSNREAAEREISALDAETDAIEAQKKTLNEDKIRAEAQSERQRAEIERASAAIEAADREQEKLLARVAEMRQKSLTSEEMTKELSEQLDTLQNEIAENTEILAGRNTENAALRESLQALQTNLMLARRDLSQFEQERDRLIEAHENGSEQQARENARLRDLQDKITGANEKLSALTLLRERLEVEKDELESKIGTQNAKSLDCERRINELRAAEKENTARRDNLYREVVRLDEQKSAAETEKNGIAAKLFDEYELTLSAAEDAATPIDDTVAANGRLTELRTKIKGLGSVNVGAIEEYKEVSMRYETLRRQIDDVETSKAELSRLITELTGQMCVIFSEKFAEIDRNFRRIFTELFEGGSASLSLTEPDNVLESGIEISVHPPGKLIKNLAALSGGEQAFVSIAIFFAILCVNPSPFCLMDEIEAALDDVNVARFAAYMHRLTDKTQFITITHRRGTMEQADVLYGVTMQEEGVSKLLRLKVAEIENVLDAKNK